MDELLKYMKALVFLQAHGVANSEKPVKTEVLLARAGLDYAEIAAVLGKTESAVAKSVQRAK